MTKPSEKLWIACLALVLAGCGVGEGGIDQLGEQGSLEDELSLLSARFGDGSVSKVRRIPAEPMRVVVKIRGDGLPVDPSAVKLRNLPTVPTLLADQSSSTLLVLSLPLETVPAGAYDFRVGVLVDPVARTYKLSQQLHLEIARPPPAEVCTTPTPRPRLADRDLYASVAEVTTNGNDVTAVVTLERTDRTCANTFYRCGDLKQWLGARGEIAAGESWHGVLCGTEYLGQSGVKDVFRLRLKNAIGGRRAAPLKPGTGEVYLHWQDCSIASVCD